jgi:hypothetical protein
MPNESADQVAKASRAVNEAVAPSKPPEEKPAPQPKEYTFHVEWKNPQGRRYHGDFSAHIMSVKESITVGILRAQLCAGVPAIAIDQGTLDMTEMVATLQVVIDDGPDWAKDLIGIYDHALIWEIYKEVRDRENRFRGRSDKEG